MVIEILLVLAIRSISIVKKKKKKQQCKRYKYIKKSIHYQNSKLAGCQKFDKISRKNDDLICKITMAN